MGKKKNSRIKSTPGSGEALLGGQVKTLLQKVAEEAELTKISMDTRPFIHLVNSPIGLLAPTPANTPQIPDLSGGGLGIFIASPVVEEHLRNFQVALEEKEKSLESQKSLSITRSLLLDFSDKSESRDSSECYSVVTQKCESKPKEKPAFHQDEDDSSVWSMQVNVSTRGKNDEDGSDEFSSYMGEEDEEEDDDKGDFLEGLCEGMRNMSMREEFAGKHIRFVYDSEDEEIVEEKEAKQSPGVLRLKGLPTPKGKHYRFAAEEEEDKTDART